MGVTIEKTRAEISTGLPAKVPGLGLPLHSRPNPQLAKYVAGLLARRAVLILDFSAPRKAASTRSGASGRPAVVRASSWGANQEIQACLQELGMELVEDLDKGFTDSEDLGRALSAEES